MGQPIILGIKFLLSHKALINFDKQIIRLADNIISFKEENNAQALTVLEKWNADSGVIKMRIYKDIIIHADEEVYIPLRPDEGISKEDLMLYDFQVNVELLIKKKLLATTD